MSITIQQGNGQDAETNDTENNERRVIRFLNEDGTIFEMDDIVEFGPVPKNVIEKEQIGAGANGGIKTLDKDKTQNAEQDQEDMINYFEFDSSTEAGVHQQNNSRDEITISVDVHNGTLDECDEKTPLLFKNDRF